MGLLKRMSDLIRSNVNDVLDKAEDPRKILEQTILDMEGEHKKAKKMLLETLTLLKQSEKQRDGHQKSAQDWENKAMAALKAGNEDLARQALAEKAKIDELHKEAQQGVQQQSAYTDELKRSLSELEAKINEARKKRDELLARLSAAELKKKQADMQQGGLEKRDAVRDTSAFDTFDRMVNRIETSEAEIEARRELAGTVGVGVGADVERELQKELEAHSAEAALDALKAKMSGQSDAPTSAPAASNPASVDPKAKAIEDELASLRAKLDGDS